MSYIRNTRGINMYIEVNKVGDNYEVTPNVTPTPAVTPLQGLLIISYEEGVIFRGVALQPEVFYNNQMLSNSSDVWENYDTPYNSDQHITVCGTMRYFLSEFQGYVFMKVGDTIYGWDKNTSDNAFTDAIVFSPSDNSPTVTDTGSGAIIQPGTITLQPGETVDITLSVVPNCDNYYIYDNSGETPDNYEQDVELTGFSGPLLVIAIDWTQHTIALSKYAFVVE